ncbi:MAG TPA: pyridoxal 5'-phosphate synthase glutaminase subunit PdxT [Bryobacteraceae bacterium]|nr:pyridoxal 5'-phosphate synthase glutaminase subunit PdxT [Bryobacteraceae bacterium]
MARPLIGILALQGDFEAHAAALARAGADAFQVRTAGELDRAAALVIPGGESTTMLKLLREESLFDTLLAFGRRRPIFGTCAGAILLASRVTHPEQESLGLMDFDIERNGYGRQLDSRVASLDDAVGGPLEAVFIRAPIIRRVGPAVRVLARYQGEPVLLEDGLHLAATFHPELSQDGRIHRRFVEKTAL